MLGFLQGFLEWLPVSSEGQIFVILTFLGYTNASLNVKMAFWLHLGTASAVILYYREKFVLLLDFKNEESLWLWKFLILTTFGTILIALPIRVFLIEVIPSSLGPFLNLLVALFLIITGIMLSKWNNFLENAAIKLYDLSNNDHFLAGIVQGFAALPGISRSGITISYFLAKKLRAEDAFNGSFWMSVPASLGAVGLEILLSLFKHEPVFPSGDALGVFIGILMAFIVGFITLGALIRFARNYSFSLICFVLAGLIILGVIVEVVFA